MSGLLWYGVYLAVASAVLRVVISRKAHTRPVGVKGLALVVAAAVTLLLTDCPWFGDLESAYYPAASLIRSTPEHLYLTNCAEGFVNVPIVALVFVPLAYIDYRIAAGLLTMAGVAAILVAAWLATSLFARTPAQRWYILAAFALNGPLWYSVREGNTTHFILVALLLSWSLAERGHGALAGGILGGAAIIKAPLAIFGLYFVARRRWREAAGMLAAAAAIVAVSVALYGLALHQTWFDRCVMQTAGRVIPGFNVQSVDGVLARAYGANPFDWDPIRIVGLFPTLRMLLIGVLGSLVSLALWRHGHRVRRTDQMLEWCLVLILSLLVFPLSWTHYYSFLLVPISLLIAGHVPLNGAKGWQIAAGVSVVLVSLPLEGLRTSNAMLGVIFERLLASAHFVGGITMLAVALKALSSANSTSTLDHLHQRASQ